MACSYGAHPALKTGSRRCTADGAYFVYLTDPLTDVWPAIRCRRHALTELLGSRYGPHRAVGIDTLRDILPVPIPEDAPP